MANQFGIQISEDFCTAYAERLKVLRAASPDKTYVVMITLDVIPDGVGVEFGTPQLSIVEVAPESAGEVKEIVPGEDAAIKKAHFKKKDIATRRSEGAKSGWEIRRAKQKSRELQ